MFDAPIPSTAYQVFPLTQTKVIAGVLPLASCVNNEAVFKESVLYVAKKLMGRGRLRQLVR